MNPVKQLLSDEQYSRSLFAFNTPQSKSPHKNTLLDSQIGAFVYSGKMIATWDGLRRTIDGRFLLKGKNTSSCNLLARDYDGFQILEYRIGTYFDPQHPKNPAPLPVDENLDAITTLVSVHQSTKELLYEPVSPIFLDDGSYTIRGDDLHYGLLFTPNGLAGLHTRRIFSRTERGDFYVKPVRLDELSDLFEQRKSKRRKPSNNTPTRPKKIPKNPLF